MSERPGEEMSAEEIERWYNKLMVDLGDRDVNTIPIGVELTITFKEPMPKPGSYHFKSKGGGGDRETSLIKAVIKYNKKASHLIADAEYPLSLPGNALRGLYNHLKAKKQELNLNNKTFKVKNKNKHTYMWKDLNDKG